MHTLSLLLLAALFGGGQCCLLDFTIESRQTCPPLLFDFTHATCSVNATTIDCDQSQLREIDVSVECKPGFVFSYQTTGSDRQQWTFNCTPSVSPENYHGTIVGGQRVDIVNYPYQLSLQKEESYICGASIISNVWALTAAHCVTGSVIIITLRAGSSFKDSGGTLHQAVKKVVHAQYNSETYDYDIALLKVETPFIFGRGVATIQLPPQDEPVATGTICDISGWGALAEGGNSSERLQTVKLPVVDQNVCKASYRLIRETVTARMICAGIPAGVKDACQGDSGGPMVANNKLVGVTSWGEGCARPGYPGVYARVANLRTWITENSGV